MIYLECRPAWTTVYLTSTLWRVTYVLGKSGECFSSPTLASFNSELTGGTVKNLRLLFQFLLTDEHLYSPCFWDSTAGYDTLGFIGQFLQATVDFYAIKSARLVFSEMCSQEISLHCKIIKKTQEKKSVIYMIARFPAN